jgi:hypothetical protein
MVGMVRILTGLKNVREIPVDHELVDVQTTYARKFLADHLRFLASQRSMVTGDFVGLLDAEIMSVTNALLALPHNPALVYSIGNEDVDTV